VLCQQRRTVKERLGTACRALDCLLDSILCHVDCSLHRRLIQVEMSSPEAVDENDKGSNDGQDDGKDHGSGEVVRREHRRGRCGGVYGDRARRWRKRK